MSDLEVGEWDECDGIEEVQRGGGVRSWLASSEDGEQRGQVGWVRVVQAGDDRRLQYQCSQYVQLYRSSGME